VAKAKVVKTLKARLEQKGGEVRVVHGNLLKALRLDCSWADFDAALEQLKEGGHVTVSRNQTHTTIALTTS